MVGGRVWQHRAVTSACYCLPATAYCQVLATPCCALGLPLPQLLCSVKARLACYCHPFCLATAIPSALLLPSLLPSLLPCYCHPSALLTPRRCSLSVTNTFPACYCPPLQVRGSIKAVFPERDCFALVRPALEEQALAKMDSLPLSALRPEFRQVGGWWGQLADGQPAARHPAARVQAGGWWGQLMTKQYI